MFNCRMCSQLPAWIPGVNLLQENKTKTATSKPPTSRTSKRDVSKFTRRSEEEMQILIRAWEQYVHPRAREFFPTQEMLEGVLMQVARGIHRTEDPILGDDQCVHWYGEVTKDDQQAAIRMIKPGDTQESVTYVNRVLVFIFATDQSFDQLMRLPKEPFRMNCGDQLCVNLNHISLSS